MFQIHNFKDVNGKTLHLVQRVPPTNISRPSDESNATTGQSATFNNLGPSVTGGIGVNQAGNLNQDVQQIINQLLGGLGEFGQNATFNANTNVFIFSFSNLIWLLTFNLINTLKKGWRQWHGGSHWFG